MASAVLPSGRVEPELEVSVPPSVQVPSGAGGTLRIHCSLSDERRGEAFALPESVLTSLLADIARDKDCSDTANHCGAEIHRRVVLLPAIGLAPTGGRAGSASPVMVAVSRDPDGRNVHSARAAQSALVFILTARPRVAILCHADANFAQPVASPTTGDGDRSPLMWQEHGPSGPWRNAHRRYSPACNSTVQLVARKKLSAPTAPTIAHRGEQMRICRPSDNPNPTLCTFPLPGAWPSKF